MRRILFSLIALVGLLWSVNANAACGGPCFWIGGTGTLNLTSDSAHWSASSGGATCSCEPATTEDITFDGSSGGGTVTVNTAGTWTANSLTYTAFTGTINFAANNNNITVATNVDNTGTTATLNMGNGTWTLSGPNSFFRTVSGATFNANSSTLSFTGNGIAGSFRRLFSAGKTFSTINIATNANEIFSFQNSLTVGTLTVAAPNRIAVSNGSVVTVTNAVTITGSSGSEVSILGDIMTAGGGLGAWVSANNLSCTWCAIGGVNFSGGGTFTATNSFDLGVNTGITITAPSGGGGGGGHIIGGG